MVDPVSLGAIGAVLGAVGSGMANEAGKWAWESAGGLVRRIAGGEVTAPTTPGQLDDVARLVHERVQRDPQLAQAWVRFAAGVRAPGIGSGLHRPCLPTALHFFTDRQKALKTLDKEAARAFAGRPRLALLHGPEGIGTSTLAIHWRWRQTARFPDGQLYADLRARSGSRHPAARTRPRPRPPLATRSCDRATIVNVGPRTPAAPESGRSARRSPMITAVHAMPQQGLSPGGFRKAVAGDLGPGAQGGRPMVRGSWTA